MLTRFDWYGASKFGGLTHHKMGADLYWLTAKPCHWGISAITCCQKMWFYCYCWRVLRHWAFCAQVRGAHWSRGDPDHGSSAWPARHSSQCKRDVSHLLAVQCVICPTSYPRCNPWISSTAHPACQGWYRVTSWKVQGTDCWQFSHKNSIFDVITIMINIVHWYSVNILILIKSMPICPMWALGL